MHVAGGIRAEITANVRHELGCADIVCHPDVHVAGGITALPLTGPYTGSPLPGMPLPMGGMVPPYEGLVLGAHPIIRLDFVHMYAQPDVLIRRTFRWSDAQYLVDRYATHLGWESEEDGGDGNLASTALTYLAQAEVLGQEGASALRKRLGQKGII